MKKHLEQSLESIHTTIGELVEALTQVAQEDGNTPDKSYELAAETLSSILSRQDRQIDILPR
ncbi:hypothetical protein MRY87_00610 [bacterium]|nr:hypothetical protein [bacterium]